MTNTWYRKLQAMGACEDAVEWAKSQPSFAVAWRTCARPDWMLWLLPKIGVESRKLVEIACTIAESVEGNSKDPRVSACNRMTREWLAGNVSNDQLSAAWSAAESAVWSAEGAEWSAAWSAESAVWSAVWSAESAVWSAASAAAESAESAARSAERSAERAAWSAESAVWSAAWSAESAVWSAVWSAESAASAARSTQVGIIRAHFPQVTLTRKIAQ